MSDPTIRFYLVSLGGDTLRVPQDQAMAVAAELVAKHGGIPSITLDTAETAAPVSTPAEVPVTAPTLPAAALSTFEAPVVAGDAKARIDTLQAKLVAAGVQGVGFRGDGGTGGQFFTNGTRMMAEGYDTMRARLAQHEKAEPIAVAANALAMAVKNEGREDLTCSAREFAQSLAVNGKITAFGKALTEQSVRGIVSRLESPALGYILGLRTRIAAEMNRTEEERNVSALRADRAKIAEVLHHECMRDADRALKLRTRKNPGDIFAIVSPEYSNADAPEVVQQILSQLPQDCKGTWTYDATSTSWELRADVWTSTPVDDQAVGEPFSGFASFRARDNGTSRFRGGGGIEIIRCLNASVYVADGSTVDRVHRGRIMYNIGAMLREASASIHVLCEAWGRNASLEIPVPAIVDEKPMTLDQAIPGLFRHMLTNRRELVGVLPGRTESHVEALTRTYATERRNPYQVVRADMAHTFTRHIQDLPEATRRTAETAIGSWLVDPTPARFDLRA